MYTVREQGEDGHVAPGCRGGRAVIVALWYCSMLGALGYVSVHPVHPILLHHRSRSVTGPAPSPATLQPK